MNVAWIQSATLLLLVTSLVRHGVAGPPVLLGFYTNGLQASHVRLQHGSSNACVAAFLQPESFAVISVTNPALPTRTGGVSLPQSGDRLTLSSDESLAFMVGFFGGLKILSVASPASPQLLGTYNPGGSGRDVVVSVDGRTAYVALESAGVEILSVTNPALPERLGGNSADFGGSAGAFGLALSKDESLLYVAAGVGGVKVLSLSNPATPVVVGAYTPSLVSPLTATFLSGDGNVLYTLGGGSAGEFALRILSITNPVQPEFVTGYEDPIRSGGFVDMTLSEDERTAFVVGNNVGLQVVDVTPGFAPVFVTEFYEIIDESAPQATGIDLSGNESTAYIAQGFNGLRVVDVSGVYDIDDDGLPNWWERTYFANITAAVQSADTDLDTQSNLEEYISGTHPNNVTSVFRVVSITHSSTARIGVQSVSGREYSLIYSDTLDATNLWQATTGAQDVPGTGGLLLLENTNAPVTRFYGVNVRLTDE